MVWKRGPEEQFGELIDMGPDTTEVETKVRFVKVSSFYTKDDRVTHEPKMCEILLQTVSDEGEKNIFARMEFNMAPCVKIQKTEVPTKISFPASQFGNTYIDAVWTIFADKEMIKS